MGTVKPWQIAVIVVGLLGALGMSFYSCSRNDTSIALDKDVTLVDVKTGEMFIARYPEKRPISYPAKNPGSGELNLFPVYAKEGHWFINPRSLTTVRKHATLNSSLLSDPKSGQIKVENPSPKRADVFGE